MAKRTGNQAGRLGRGLEQAQGHRQRTFVLSTKQQDAGCLRPHKVTFKGAGATVLQLDTTMLAELAKRKTAVENISKLGNGAGGQDKLNGLEKELALRCAQRPTGSRRPKQFKAKRAGGGERDQARRR